jgi:hypothetical protein
MLPAGAKIRCVMRERAWEATHIQLKMSQAKNKGELAKNSAITVT